MDQNTLINVDSQKKKNVDSLSIIWLHIKGESLSNGRGERSLFTLGMPMHDLHIYRAYLLRPTGENKG